MNNELGKCIAEVICRAWNELDASLFEPILSDDFEYISVWVLETMKGKDRYMEYISGKFESIKKGNNPVIAEILYQEIIDKFVVVLNQGGNLAALEPAISEGMLNSLWMRPIDMTLPAVFTSKSPVKAYKVDSPNQIKAINNEIGEIQKTIQQDIDNIRKKPESERPWYMKSMNATSSDLLEAIKLSEYFFKTNYASIPIKWLKVDKDEDSYCDLIFEFGSGIFDILIEYHYGNVNFLDISKIEKCSKESHRVNHIPCIAAITSETNIIFMDPKTTCTIDFKQFL